ncbi:MAG: HlyD family type I secretion periplasmic adaptor subunit [Thermodesulfovibrio sp.]|nr:HlyD family type I secretion periplasmic adaptor subunit [Thermodesulfovibrio sp.]
MEQNKIEEKEQTKEKYSVKKIIKITLIILACTLGVFLIWAAFAPLDQGAPAIGYVAVANYKKVVQHQYGGTVKDILVKEGDEVKKGQTLIKLEDSEIKAKYANVRAEYLSALVIYSRLQAERAFMPKIIYPQEVIQMKDDPEIKKVINVQEQLFKARKLKLETEKKVVFESAKGLKDYSFNLQRQKSFYENQLRIVEKQIEKLRDLSDEGYFPRNRFLELERTSEELRGKIAEITANQLRAEASVNEFTLRANAIEREYIKEVESELAETEKKLPALRDSFTAVQDMLEKTEIKAPDDGIAMGLKVHTIGGVIQAGQIIMEVVPKNSELIVEAKLSPAHVEDVKKGQMADLRFITLDPKKTPVLDGELIYISPDVMYDEANKATFYLVKLKIKESSLEQIKKINKDITPGMPVQVVIKTGSRTFLSYLFKPLFDRLAISFLK